MKLVPQINPLLVVLAEAKANGDDCVCALLKVGVALFGYPDPIIPYLSAEWELMMGEPTWEKIERFCRVLVADPENREIVAEMRTRHENLMAGLTPDERAYMEPFLDGAA